MKKTLSLLLTALLLLSSLVGLISCGGEGATTVTAEEWAAALAESNATVEGYLTENGKRELILFKITEKLYFSDNDGYRAYCVEREDGWHVYAEGNTEGPRIDGFTPTVGTALMSFHLPAYEAFTYDEKLGAYTVRNKNYPATHYSFRLYFEDGRLVKFESLNKEETVTYSFAITDHGKTKLTLPDYLK